MPVMKVAGTCSQTKSAHRLPESRRENERSKGWDSTRTLVSAERFDKVGGQMKSVFLRAVAITALSVPAFSLSNSVQTLDRFQAYAEQGGHSMAGMTSTTSAARAYPFASISVFLPNTSTLATIFSDAANTPKANPFTADSTGFWLFYAPSGLYDVGFSGPGLAIPFTLYALSAKSESSLGFHVTSDYAAASVGASIDAACHDFGGSFGIVLVPTGQAAGKSAVGLLDNCIQMDLRGLGVFDYRGSSVASLLDDRFNIYRRQTSPRTNSANANKHVLSLTGEPWTGGINITGTKSEYEVLSIYQSNHTPGQHSALTVINNNASSGDTIAVAALAQNTGNCANAGGDEGCIGVRVASTQLTNTFTARVSSVSGSTINYDTAVEPAERGEGRYLIVTNRGLYTVGTVTNITGTPPTFNGSATSWLSLCPGGVACRPANLFIEITGSNTASSDRYVFKVNSITGDSSLTISTVGPGDQGWVGDNVPCSGRSPCAYTIYSGGTITAIGYGDSVTVDTPASFVAKDTILSPLGTGQLRIGVRAVMSQVFPDPIGGAGIVTNNIGPRRLGEGVLVSGSFTTGLEFATMPTTYGIYFTDSSSTAPAPSQVIYVNDKQDNHQVILARIRRNSRTGADLVYLKALDEWWMGALRWKGDQTDPRVAIGSSVDPQTDTTLHIKPKDSSATAVVIDGSITRKMICYNISKTICDFAGTGSPESVVTASVGSTFRRTDGGAGTSFYVKESGSGASGWVGK